MIVFNAFLKILNKNKGMLIFYTLILAFITYVNTQNLESSISFSAVKPDVFVINHDDSKISKDLVKYLDDNTNFVKLENNEEKINDAVFYRDVNYVIYIPENFGSDIMSGLKPTIDIKTTGDYNASYAEMLLSRYIKALELYSSKEKNEDKVIKNIRSTINAESDVSVYSKLDTQKYSKMSLYFDFTNYSIIAALVYVICIVLVTFKNEKIYKRTIVSGMNYKLVNKYLLYSNLLLALFVYLLYVLISFFIVGDIMFTYNGLICLINMFIFTVCSTTFAMFIGNLVTTKEAISGIINVVALGSSFLCGAFVPQSWLPDVVIFISHVFPSYYFIRSNDIAYKLESFDFNSLTPIIINNVILILFSIVFIILSFNISKKKREIG